MAGLVAALAFAVAAPQSANAAVVHQTSSSEPKQTSCPASAADEAAAAVTARMCHGRVAVADATTNTDMLYVNANGTRTLEHHYRPVRVRVNGTWAPADATLVPRKDGSIGPKASTVDLRLSAGGSTDLLSVSDGTHTVALSSPLGKPLPMPTLTGATATYANVLPGVDLRVIADVDGYAEQLVVKNAAAGANPALTALSFPVRATHATLSADSAGNPRVMDSAGRQVFASSAPRMWAADADGAGAATPALQRPGQAVVPLQAALPVTIRNGTVGIRPNHAILTSNATKFPVVIDPGITEARLNWTWVDSGEPTSAYWNSTDNARVGSSDSGADVRRSFFQMSVGSLSGAHIDSATFNAPEIWAWSCIAEPVDLWETGGISTTTTWNNQPSWLVKESTVKTAKGWSSSGVIGGASSCPAATISFDATNAVRDAVAKKWPNLTLALRSPNESNNLYWKRFSNNPTMSVTYNVAPAAPTNLAVTPSVGGYASSLQGTLSAKVTSPDGSPLAVQYEVWSADYSTDVCYVHPTTPNVPSGGTASWQMNTPRADNTLYHLRVRSYDGISYSPWSSYLDFTTDATAPGVAPTVSSTDYPVGAWSKGAGQDGSFTFGASGVGDVSSYLYGLDQNPPTTSVAAGSLGGTATATATPQTAGPHTLFTQSVDRAGNKSPIASYTFYVGTAAVTSPGYGDIVAGTTSLQGAAPSDTTGVTFQWRRADTDNWTNIPTSDVTVAAGGGAVTWPVASSGGGYPKLNWNVMATLASANSGVALAGPLQTRAMFTGGSGGASPSVPFTFDMDRATAATVNVGPGSVNLVTGAFTVTHTDAPADTVGVTRTYHTRQSSIVDPMFGPGWVSSVSVNNASSPYSALTATGSLVQVGTSNGSTIGFTSHTADAATTTYTPQVGAENLTLTYAVSGDTYTLSDADGTVVTFTHLAGAASGSYSPSSVTTPGSDQTSTVSWQAATVGGTTVTQPTRVLAPVPSGVTCTTLVRGCKALTFTYATATSATGTGQGQWGSYAGRVAQVSFTAWDPDASPPAMRTVAVAGYAFDSNGRLRQQWDPRLDWTNSSGTQHVADTYSYGTDGALASLTPPGQLPWQFTYTTVPGDTGAGRLASVSRSALSSATATTTVVYGVPVSGSTAPYDMSVGQTGRWGQSEAPVAATAVFDPGQVPDGNQSSGTLPSSWTRATITYLDANSRQTNVALPGGYTDATWYDRWGNTMRTLTAGNRQAVLAASGTDSASDEAALAAAASTLDVYSPDGQELTNTFGPTHAVVLASGTTVRGRDHTKTYYDQGAPTDSGPYRLSTSEANTIAWWDSNGTQHDDDPQTTTTAYDWTLRQQTSSTVDPSGLALTSRLGYDSTTGQLNTETTPAGGTSTTTPQTQQTVFYTSATNSTYAECGGHPEWSGMICRTQPGGQAATGPELPVKVLTYDMFGQPRTVVEQTSAGVLRTTTTTYDAAGRTSTVSVTTAAGLGTQVPTTKTVYDPATNQQTATQSLDANGNVIAQVSRAYDLLGRITSYTDADGNTTTTTYDLLSRPATVTDGSGTRTYTYDGGTEHRSLATSVTDSQGGTFTATYDADGHIVSQSWPDGITVTTGYDERGATNSVSYDQPTCGQDNCTLFAQSATVNARDDIASLTSTLSSQTFGYDAAKRLTSTAETVAGQCTTRTYAFNTATDRTGLTTYAPAADGSCQTSTAASTATWTYDAADRITSGGYAYDALGRATTVPAGDTQNPTDGNLTASYYGSNMVAGLAQGSAAATYTIDPTGKRIRTRVEGSTTLVNHYSDDSDSPAWSTAAGVTSRTILGVGGIAAQYSSTDGLTWQLTDLQGNLVAGVSEGGIGLEYTSPYNEYGQAGNAGDVGSRQYGWQGGARRAADEPGGVVLMGARMYLTGTGSFTSPDSVTDGGANAYGYCSGDPVNCTDTNGQGDCSVHWILVWTWIWWKFTLCSVVVNIGPRSVYVAKDRAGHWSNKPAAGTQKRWLPPHHSSKMYWPDTDLFRWYGIWIPVWDGETAYVYIGYWGWS